MVLSDFVRESDIHLDLHGDTRDEILTEMVASLELPAQESSLLFKVLQRREQLGSTGIGRGVAVPHCRTPLVHRLRVVYGRRPGGVAYDAVDGQPVTHFFLLVAPPVEVSNDYLPMLGRIAQLVKEADVPERLAAVQSPAEFLALLEQKGI
jgi:mannitol/fructose-specific phosphotransferase system IIA component (Ntr-type)